MRTIVTTVTSQKVDMNRVFRTLECILGNARTPKETEDVFLGVFSSVEGRWKS